MPQHKLFTYNPLSILRTLAIFAVIIWHTSPVNNMIFFQGHDVTFLIHPGGFPGIWIFLCLSGYLIGKGFFSGKYTLHFKGILRFYRNRILRIVPLYLFIIVLTSFTVYRETGVHWESLGKLLTFTATDFISLGGYNGNLWTISLLMQFYLIVPAIYFLTQWLYKKRIPFVFPFIITVITGLGIRQYLFQRYAFVDMYTYIVYIYTPLLANFDMLFFSFLLNYGIGQIKNSTCTGFFNKYVSMGLLIFLYLLTGYYSGIIDHSYNNYSKLFIFYLPVITYISIGYFIVTSEIPNPQNHFYIPGTKFITRMFLPLAVVLDRLAILSFGIYIWHWPVMDYFSLHVAIGDTVYIGIYKTAATTVISILLAFVTYLCIEKPFMVLKRT
jgi:peptidoglycan/LPS O-acetylase OafA/YrhL